MKFRPNRREDDIDINVISMVDILFVLLLFFMLTTTFTDKSALKIELPTASNAAQNNAQDKLELLIDGQGRYYINGREVLNSQPETLFQAMSMTLEEMGNNTPPLVISADAAVNYQAVVTAMDIAGRLGLTNFSMATSQSTRKPQE
jgi:biopolymer transport protein ExbD